MNEFTILLLQKVAESGDVVLPTPKKEPKRSSLVQVVIERLSNQRLYSQQFIFFITYKWAQ